MRTKSDKKLYLNIPKEKKILQKIDKLSENVKS